MRTTGANYRAGVSSLLAGTETLRRGMGDLNAGLYGFTPEGRRQAELKKMLDEATKRRAAMDMEEAGKVPGRDPALDGMPMLPVGEMAPPPNLAGMPRLPVGEGMPMPQRTGTPTPGPVSIPPSMSSPVVPPMQSGDAQRRREFLISRGLPPDEGPPPSMPQSLGALIGGGMGNWGGPPAPKGESPAMPPAPSGPRMPVAGDHFSAGPLAKRPPADPFGGERKGLLLDRAIATLQKNPGQASAMTDRLMGRAQEDTPDAIRADIETLSALDGSPEAYRSAMPQMRSNLGRKELFAQITEGINRKRTESSEAEKFNRQKELKRMEEEGATGRTKMTIEGQKDVAATRAAATLESNLARIIAAKQKAEGKPVLTVKDYMALERSTLRDAESNAQAAYATMADARGYPKEGFTDDDVKNARTAWQAAQVAQSQWDAQASMRRWQKEYVTASATAPEIPGPAATGGANPQTTEEWSKYLAEVPDEEFDAAQARYEAWKATQE